MANSARTLELEVVFHHPEKGGRTNLPTLRGSKYRPHLVVPPDDEMLGVEFVESSERDLVFGQPAVVTVSLPYIGISYQQLKPGAAFEIFEGPRRVGYGRVLGGKRLRSNKSFKPRPLRGSAHAVSCTTPPRRYAVRLNSGVKWPLIP